MFMSATAPLHPQPERAPSVTYSDPSQLRSASVGRARHIMRAGLAEQNLPGVSVAVGVGGVIVWAEGFGWADVKNRAPVTPDTRETGHGLGWDLKTVTLAGAPTQAVGHDGESGPESRRGVRGSQQPD